MCPIRANNLQVTLLLCTTMLFAEKAILQACYIAVGAIHAAEMHMHESAPGYASQSACNTPTAMVPLIACLLNFNLMSGGLLHCQSGVSHAPLHGGCTGHARVSA